MGVLKGIYMYEHDSNSEFKDWATDIPGECFRELLDKWKKHSLKCPDFLPGTSNTCVGLPNPDRIDKFLIIFLPNYIWTVCR